MKQLLLLCAITSFFVAHGQTWEELQPYPGSPRDDGTVFVIGEKAYCGAGRNQGFAVTSDFYVFDANVEQWSPISALPDNAKRQYAVGLSHGNYGYVFGGIDAQGAYLNDLWRYDANNDVWDYLGAGPFSGRSGAQGFVLGDTLYFAGGKTANSAAVNDVWCYSITSDSWFLGPTLPAEGVWRGFGVSNDTLGIVGLGLDSTGQKRAEVYFFDGQQQSWSAIAFLHADSLGYPAAALKGNRILVYGGETTAGTYSNDFRYIDLSDSTWHMLTGFPATARRGSMAFSINDDFYLATGITTTARLDETWAARNVLITPEFEPIFSRPHEPIYVSNGVLHCGAQWTECYLFDTVGKTVKLKCVSEGQFEVPGAVKTGSYLVRLDAGSSMLVDRVFIGVVD